MMTGSPMVSTYSMWSLFRNCRKAVELRYLQQLVPQHFQNAWTVVAFALVMATLLKGVFDYIGTYLVNYAGFGLIT